MPIRHEAALAAALSCSVAALVATFALPVHAAQRSACQRLKGVDRAPDRNVKLVERTTSERLADRSRGSRLVGCVLPRGPLRTIAKRKGVANDLAEEFGFTIHQVRGRFVALDQRGTEGGYGSALQTTVWDLRSGRWYVLARSCYGKDVPCAAAFDVALRVIVTRDGRAVAVLAHQDFAHSTAGTLVVAYAAGGAARLLDAGAPGDIPAASLALSGNLASWTNAGQSRGAGL